jgi:hypothetical protein
MRLAGVNKGAFIASFWSKPIYVVLIALKRIAQRSPFGNHIKPAEVCIHTLPRHRHGMTGIVIV